MIQEQIEQLYTDYSETMDEFELSPIGWQLLVDDAEDGDADAYEQLTEVLCYDYNLLIAWTDITGRQRDGAADYLDEKYWIDYIDYCEDI